jgi:group I intron endonuclease
MFIYVIKHRDNGKCYVGQDSGPVHERRRIKAHLAEAQRLRSGRPIRGKSKIVRALAKYSDEAFEFIVHSADYKTKQEIDNAEIALIKELDSIVNGYNIMPGGQGFIPNAMVDNNEVLLRLFEMRSRGAEISNKNRWSNASDEDRAKWKEQRESGKTPEWRTSLKQYWDEISPEARAERGKSVSESNKVRYDLISAEGVILVSETKLRRLLDYTGASGYAIRKKTVERIVKNEGYYAAATYSIKKRTVG